MSASIIKIKLRLHVADKGKDFGLEEGAGFRCGMYIIACRNVKKSIIHNRVYGILYRPLSGLQCEHQHTYTINFMVSLFGGLAVHFYFL